MSFYQTERLGTDAQPIFLCFSRPSSIPVFPPGNRHILLSESLPLSFSAILQWQIISNKLHQSLLLNDFW